jgi:antitoxin PrlF
MAHSKITSKFQTTIPKDIRKHLNLKAGDLIAFNIENGSIVIQKIERDPSYLKSLESTLSEWNSKEDDEHFADLQDL